MVKEVKKVVLKKSKISKYDIIHFNMNSTEAKMNLKLNNDVRPRERTKAKKNSASIKEERQRTGRYIAILVGISLLLLACYHAWIRKIPVVASLVVPALIMFIYVGWVLYSANREKHRLLDLEAAIHANQMKERQEALAAEQVKKGESSGKNSPRPQSPNGSIHRDLSRVPSNLSRKSYIMYETRRFIKPIILVNDRPPDDNTDDKWTHIVDVLSQCEKFKAITSRQKYKRKFCRSKKTTFKRSYSIA